MVTSQLKENITQGWLLYVIRSFLQVRFRFSINSLLWSDFLLNSFHLAEVSLSALFRDFILFCVQLSKKKHEILLFIIINNFSTQFAVNLFHLHNLKNNSTTHVNERNQDKNVTRHIQMDRAFSCSI